MHTHFKTYTRRERYTHMKILDSGHFDVVSLQCEREKGRARLLPQSNTKNISNPCRSKSRFHSPPPTDITSRGAEQEIMAIPYSLTLCQVRPGKPEQGNKTYPKAQYAQLLNLDAMAEHMTSHDSKYNKGDIMAMATQLTTCIREQLLMGNKVVLGDLGAFYVSLVSDAANNAESFHTNLIKKVKVKWDPSDKFSNLINEAQFTFAGSRKAQAEARKAERELLNSMATIQPGQEPDDDGGDDNTSGGDGNLE